MISIDWMQLVVALLVLLMGFTGGVIRLVMSVNKIKEDMTQSLSTETGRIDKRLDGIDIKLAIIQTITSDTKTDHDKVVLLDGTVKKLQDDVNRQWGRIRVAETDSPARKS